MYDACVYTRNAFSCRFLKVSPNVVGPAMARRRRRWLPTYFSFQIAPIDKSRRVASHLDSALIFLLPLQMPRVIVALIERYLDVPANDEENETCDYNYDFMLEEELCNDDPCLSDFGN